jgi:hypothetical protein
LDVCLRGLKVCLILKKPTIWANEPNVMVPMETIFTFWAIHLKMNYDNREEICKPNLSYKIGSIREGCLFLINLT